MCPELDLEVTDFLYRFLHLIEKSFEFDHICKFWVNMFVLQVILFDIIFNDIAIAEDCELLL